MLCCPTLTSKSKTKIPRWVECSLPNRKQIPRCVQCWLPNRKQIPRCAQCRLPNPKHRFPDVPNVDFQIQNRFPDVPAVDFQIQNTDSQMCPMLTFKSKTDSQMCPMLTSKSQTQIPRRAQLWHPNPKHRFPDELCMSISIWKFWKCQDAQVHKLVTSRIKFHRNTMFLFCKSVALK